MHSYHSQKTPIRHKAYGRTLQQLITTIAAHPEKSKRTQQAQALLKVMRILNPDKSSGTSFTQSDWTSLYHMSDGQLEVDASIPLSITAAQPLQRDRMPYPAQKLRTKQYGRLLPHFLAQSRSVSPMARTHLVRALLPLMQQQHTHHHHGAEALVNALLKMLPEGVQVDKQGLLARLAPAPKPAYRKWKWKKRINPKSTPQHT